MKKLLLSLILVAGALKASSGKTKVTGIASYYHEKFVGRKTATGEKFSQNLLTAASNRFPLKSYVKVTNLKNGTSVVVKVNDRMGNKKRIIDLSTRAAKTIGFYGTGLARVSVEKI